MISSPDPNQIGSDGSLSLIILLLTTVLRLDGNSEIDAHVWSNLGY